LQYLRATQLLVIIGDCLFLPGALLSRGLLLLPAEDTRDGCPAAQPPPVRLSDTTPLETWASELNAWKVRQLRIFEAHPLFRHSPSGERWRGGGPLMMPALSGCHIATDGYLKDNTAVPLEDDVARYLSKQGIRRLFVGGQPHGQCPGVMRIPHSGLTVLIGSTTHSPDAGSASRPPVSLAGEGRRPLGSAACTVTIQGHETIVEGALADGAAHGYTLSTDWSREEGAATIVGRRLVDGSWGQTVTTSGQVVIRRAGREAEFTHDGIDMVSLVEAHSRLDPIYASSWRIQAR